MFRHVSFGTVLDCYVHFAVIPSASRTYVVYIGRYLEKLVGSFFEVMDITRFVREKSLSPYTEVVDNIWTFYFYFSSNTYYIIFQE